MTTEQKVTQYRSFLLRLWQEGETESAVAWRGEIESIQSGQHWRFASLRAMFELIHSIIPEKPSPQSTQDGEEMIGQL